mmetsp:Transcript_25541/g.36373  ORF Transcript_25541/g.36373 Transcript_25541/m.36373 type:complete len:84 (-) Transcript_25541:112-363(-)
MAVATVQAKDAVKVYAKFFGKKKARSRVDWELMTPSHLDLLAVFVLQSSQQKYLKHRSPAAKMTVETDYFAPNYCLAVGLKDL